MSDYTALLGLETAIRVDLGSGPVNIPWAKDIMMPGISTDFPDATTNSSPNGFKEFIPGLKEAGEVTFTLNYHDDESTHQGLWDAQQNSELLDFQIAMPQFATNNLFDFSGFVSGLPISSPLGDLVSQAITIKISGNIDKSTE